MKTLDKRLDEWGRLLRESYRASPQETRRFLSGLLGRTLAEMGAMYVEVVRESGQFRQLLTSVCGELPQQEDLPPPLADRRRIIRQERLAWGWLRQEFVPCNSTRCHKKPDEHGPYWYSYREVEGRWRMRYHGTAKPSFEPEFSLAEASRVVEELGRNPMIDDEGMVRLQRVATDLRLVPAESNEALARKALSLIASAREHRNQAARERHHALLARVEAGEKLSPGELEEMTILSDVLAMEH